MKLFLPLNAMTERFLMLLLLSRKVLGPTITFPTTDSFGFDLMSLTTLKKETLLILYIVITIFDAERWKTSFMYNPSICR
jgi:hypothetical protein